jgi:RNA polymerase sigma factor (sigma-70 family)
MAAFEETEQADLLRQAAGGSREAFAQLVRLHQAAVRWCLVRAVRDPVTADDLAQEVFLAAYKNLATCRSAESLRGWLLGIARNLAVQHVRSEARRRLRERGPLATQLAEWRIEQIPNLQASVLPVTTIAYGEGHFLGRVSADGKTAEFHSRAAFREFRAVAMKQFREAPGQFGQKWPALAEGAGKAIGEGIKPVSEAASPRSDIAAGSQTVEVQEGGKTISITDSKESGITVTVTESVGEKKKTTKVRAADPAELARKNPDAHQLYRKYFHPKPKTGKSK